MPPSKTTFRSKVLLSRLEDTEVALRTEQLDLAQLDKLFAIMAHLMENGYAQMKRVAEEWSPES